MGTPRICRLGTLEAKSPLIMASNGSLISSGDALGLEEAQAVFSVFHLFLVINHF